MTIAGMGTESGEDRVVVVADDHPLVREALRQALRRAIGTVRVLEAATLQEARTLVEEAAVIDLVILDLNMPGMNGFAGLAEFRADHPTLPVAMVSATTDEAVIRRALEFGAIGFIPKSAPLDTIAEAVRRILAGDSWTPVATGAVPARVAEQIRDLTPQQLKVLAMLSQGLLNKQIAHALSVGEPTVKAHVTAILKKLGVQSRTQAVIAARLLDLRPE